MGNKMEIKALFDPSKDIYRTIEKVIAYDVSQEARLKTEISEYIVTESIEDQFEKLLIKMQSAMEAGSGNEIGVWVSGFYGSGKSSFTKYLGLALDDNIKIDGVPFMQHLQDRLTKSKTKALLKAVAKRFPAAVLMIDLATEQVAGSTMEEVSTVLYYKVLQWAGYSRNLKVAAFERKLKKEGRYDEFLDYFRKKTDGEEWNNYRNDELIVGNLIPEIANLMYPELFKTPTSFTTETSEVIRFENDRVSEMLEIAREATGKEYIIFIIDELGQYVGSRPNLILNLDGLAKNLKNIGNGKVWIIGTAQQTLTEDDPRASLNSPELYKLKDRFPIQINLEANDIKEICYTRLLSKSQSGEAQLGSLFDTYGQMLRQNTKLVDARVYGADFDRQTFINLYPFLPAHFDILLHLLGALAKSTGGIGLRSAIKVIQDILIEGSDGKNPVANQQVGWLTTAVTLYDSLENDIIRAYQSLYKAVGKVRMRFPKKPVHLGVAKTVCVLQILGNLPITVQNIASLMHPEINSDSLFDSVKQAVEELISDSFVPFGEKEGQLRFFSEKINDIEVDRANIPLKTVELRRIQNEALKNVYSTLPSTHLNGTLFVQTGLKVQASNGMMISLAGDRHTIQTIVEIVDPTEYENTKIKLNEESRQKVAQYNIFLLGRSAPNMDDLITEIYRSREIISKYRSEQDQEVKEYCKGQEDRANRLIVDLEHLLKKSLVQGSYIFRGEITAVESLSQKLLEASCKHLTTVAIQVFDRYSEAPTRARTDLAEKFLRLGLNGVTSQTDPLNLVQTHGGRLSINVDHKAITSVRDMIIRQGSIEGKRLIEIFSDAPYGWSQDTLRYLIAAMLIAGEIKLKVAGREVTVNGQQAIDALKTNNSFKSVGITLREERPSNEILAKAADRITELSGENILPLEDEISKATTKLFPQLQQDYSPIAEKLKSLDLPGVDRLDTLSQEIKDLLFSDGSDAPQRLGVEDSILYANLKWASELKRSLDQGLEDTLRQLHDHRKNIDFLPDGGNVGVLKEDLRDVFEQINERLRCIEFFKYGTELSSFLTRIKTQVKETIPLMVREQEAQIKTYETDFYRIPEWKKLTRQEQDNLLADLEALRIEVVHEDLSELIGLVKQDFTIKQKVNELKTNIKKVGQQRLQEKVNEEQEEAKKTGTIITRKMTTKKQITQISDLDELISKLQEFRSELQYAHEFELIFNVNENTLEEV